MNYGPLERKECLESIESVHAEMDEIVVRYKVLKQRLEISLFSRPVLQSEQAIFPLSIIKKALNKVTSGIKK